MIEAEEEESAEGIAEKASENRMHAESVHVKYENGKRFAAGWGEMDIPRAEPDIPWKDEGVYLITGGAGGLGLIFAKEIANRTKDAVIILTGRSLSEKSRKTCWKQYVLPALLFSTSRLMSRTKQKYTD